MILFIVSDVVSAFAGLLYAARTGVVRCAARAAEVHMQNVYKSILAQKDTKE